MNEAIKQFSDGLAQAAETAGASVVLVNARRRLPASGIALDEETILTAAHVIENDEDIQVILPDGTKLSAELLGMDPSSDLAVLKLAEAKAAPAKTNNTARVGEVVLALGRPFTSGIQASFGVISAISGFKHTHFGGMLEAHYRTDATPFPGFSGGPTINVDGEVLGMNTSGLGMSKSIVIPIETAQKIVGMIKEHGSIKRGFLGVSGQSVDIPTDSQKALGRDQVSGLLLVGLEEDGPAVQGGLMIGDILVAVNGEPVENHRQLLARLATQMVGDEVEIEVLRGGKPATVKVVIGERPEFFRDGTGRGRAHRFVRRMAFGYKGSRGHRRPFEHHHSHHGRHHGRHHEGTHQEDDEE